MQANAPGDGGVQPDPDHPVQHLVRDADAGDEQVQALRRTAPILSLRPGLPEKATHDYIRNGITTLYAAHRES